MALADEHQPLKLADGKLVYPGGRIIDPADPSKPRMVEIPTNRQAQELVVQTRRKLNDLPEIPRTMNAIGAVLSYTLFGLEDSEIGIATGMSAQQVHNIKQLDGYAKMLDAITATILQVETENVRDIFKKHAKDAAHVMVDGLHNGNRQDRLFVAKDFLDRAGHRPADIVEHRHQMDGGLRIEIVRKDHTAASPIIDMDTDQ